MRIDSWEPDEKALPFLTSPYRRRMWKNAQRILHNLGLIMEVKSGYLVGSFTTQKKSPADVDFIILVKTSNKRYNKDKWAFDMVIVPDNAYGRKVVRETDMWVKKKYGTKKSTMVKLH